MKNLIDLHTHTMFCNHAYSTLKENILEAENKGLEVYGWSEHGFGMPEATNKAVFLNLKVVPKFHNNMRILKGMEMNIVDYNGDIFEKEYFEVLDYAIASLHRNCIKSSTKEENTNAVIKAMKNKKINIIGHLDDGYYELDYEKICKTVDRENFAIELNNSSLHPEGFRTNSRENLLKIMENCEKYNVKVIMNSDAHYYLEVGEISRVEDLIKEYQFPEKLIVNYNKNLIDKLLL